MNHRALLLTMLLTACSHGPQPTQPSPLAVALPSHAPDEQGRYQLPVGAERGEIERCIDEQLAARKLNEFGDPEGTTYPQSSPMQALSTRTDRYRHVMSRQPDIATICTRAPLSPSP